MINLLFHELESIAIDNFSLLRIGNVFKFFNMFQHKLSFLFESLLLIYMLLESFLQPLDLLLAQ